MADEERRWDDEEEDEVVKEPSKPFFQTIIGKIVIVVGIALFIVLATVITSNIVFSILIGNMEQPDEGLESEDTVPLVKNENIFSLGEMNLNLESPGSYLSVDVYLAYDGGYRNLRYELDKRIYQIIDKIRAILEDNKPEDIDSADEREKELKPKILNSINDMIRNGKIHAVYFKKFTIQYSPVN